MTAERDTLETQFERLQREVASLKRQRWTGWGLLTMGIIIFAATEKPEVIGSVLIGIDRNETNPIVAAKETGEIFFKDGVDHKVWKTKHRKIMARLQKKLAEHKGQRRDTQCHLMTIAKR